MGFFGPVAVVELKLVAAGQPDQGAGAQGLARDPVSGQEGPGQRHDVEPLGVGDVSAAVGDVAHAVFGPDEGLYPLEDLSALGVYGSGGRGGGGVFWALEMAIGPG
ncbi:hypothetical protein PanWU01x14_041050 [Parasponia andersonii]|uniref:Uncharacterized protein n=1 Tax=Parasponia andersonii TaxID=3476 RepID=A0A2P5DQC7_PARAD|nr:hypothetical protein PanWU01x14_041050 [Parasponia andersonii]